MNEQDLIDILINKISFSGLVSIMVTVSSKTIWNHHKKLVELSKLANKSEEIRNQIVHSLWFSEGRMKKSLNSIGGKVNSNTEEYEVNELK